MSNAFGSDPQQVTIIGESAGGASVLALLTSPETDGLFHQAMVLSGGGRQPVLGRARTGGTALAPSARQIDSAFAESLGVQAGRVDALTALRALPADDFVEGLDLSAVLTIA
ncbi:MAG: carboxylesterase family protein [Anaerolineae bacterium]